MPRYFFDVIDGRMMLDATGHECATLREARKEAARFAGELLTHAPEQLWEDGDWTVRVRDERGLQLFSVVIFGSMAPAGRACVWTAEELKAAAQSAALPKRL